MARIILLLAGFFVLVCLTPAFAAENNAESLRKAQGLVVLAPSDAFLDGYFTADEMNPAYLFGTVKDFVAAQKCLTTWLMEQGEKERFDQAAAKKSDQPSEFTRYLECDRPDGVTYYVFVDQSAMTPEQWFKWSWQFHKNKADTEYGATLKQLEKAAAEGYRVSGELRFILKNGELVSGKTPENALREDLSFAPRYDLKQGAALPKK